MRPLRFLFKNIQRTGTSGSAPVAVGNTIGDINATVGVPLEFVIVATDADSDVLTWHIDTMTANGGGIEDLGNGAEYGTRNVRYNSEVDAGTDNFTFYVNDGHADSNVATIFIVVAE
jgi:hypothetical protein